MGARIAILAVDGACIGEIRRLALMAEPLTLRTGITGIVLIQRVVVRSADRRMKRAAVEGQRERRERVAIAGIHE